MSDDAANEFFADGISEELLNVLVRVDGIGVASRTSSFAYKGRELGAAAIASELGVNHILEGSVRKAGNRVRITAQLIDAVNDRHLWSETYDRELTTSSRSRTRSPTPSCRRCAARWAPTASSAW
jgi:TolB-like protein